MIFHYPYCKVISCRDGDTVVVMIDKGHEDFRRIALRIRGYDAPEITGPEKPEGLRWKAAIESLLPPGTDVQCTTYKQSFDRYEADMVRADGLAINAVSIQAALA